MKRLASLLLLGTTSCVVPGLEIGPEQGVAGAPAAGSGGTTPLGGAAGAGEGGSGTAGGNARDPSEPHCDALPIPPKATWQVTASSSSLGNGKETDPLHNPPGHAIDGTMDERWASGLPQEEGQWFHIDFGAAAAINEVTLQQGTDLDDYPRGFEISLSHRHTDFEAVAIASGHGASVSQAVIPFERTSVGRYMLIRQTGNGPRWWSIAEIDVACH